MVLNNVFVKCVVLGAGFEGETIVFVDPVALRYSDVAVSLFVSMAPLIWHCCSSVPTLSH